MIQFAINLKYFCSKSLGIKRKSVILQTNNSSNQILKTNCDSASSISYALHAFPFESNIKNQNNKDYDQYSISYMVVAYLKISIKS